MKQVGIRKTLGSKKSTIAGQFIVESILFTLAGGLTAFVLVLVGVPYLNRVLDMELSLSILASTDLAMVLLLLLLLGSIAGIFPSIVMSRLPVLSDPQSPIQFKLSHWSGARKLFVVTQPAAKRDWRNRLSEKHWNSGRRIKRRRQPYRLWGNKRMDLIRH